MQNKSLFKLALCAGILGLGLTAGRAQTQAIWTGPSSGGEWNTAADWSALLPPGLDVNGTTNAFIGPGTNVSYNLPMTAASFGILTNYGVLSINTNGFNCSSIYMINPSGGDKLFLTNSGTIVNVYGTLTMGTNATALLSGGAALTVGSLVVDASTSSHAAGTSAFTNNGGILMANSTTVNNNSGTGTGLLLINGGTNYLGNTAVGRNNAGAGGAALGLEGLVINNGVVTMTNLNLGNAGNGASSLSGYVTGGIVTNMGGVFINQGTSGRFSRFLQTGGLFVVPDPGVVNPNPTISGSINNYTINGGTNIVGGFYFGNSNSSPGTVNFTNAATIYVGSQGINWNGAVTLTANLNNGALFGATAPWTGLTAMKLAGGTFTFRTADPNNNPNNITLSGVLSGSGGLNVTGGGTLTLSAADTYTGNTLILGGSLVVGAGGSLASSKITVGSGTTFDVSQSGGFTLNSGQTLAGLGVVTGAVMVASGATIYPGSNTLTGTLSFSNSITETGGAINEFSLAGAPGPNNDLAVISGDLDVSGSNFVYISGASLVAGDIYQLFKYSGNLNGSLTNFTVQNVSGSLTNDTANTISFIPKATLRGPANTVWIGNPANTNWDVEASTNWLNAGTLDYFVPGDNVQFTDAGASNTPVNLAAIVAPGSILVNSHSNYVFASTSGGLIAGTTGLTVTNTGTLTILTTNTYSGITTIEGGSTLMVSNLANSLSPSPIGESGLLVISNGTFVYSGPGVSIDLSTTLETTNSAINVSANGSLTLGGNLTGNGGLNVVGPGTLILNGSIAYTGVTTLSNGTLEVSGPTSLGTNDVDFDGGTLSFASASSQQFYANTLDAATTGTLFFGGANANNIIGTTGGAGILTGTGILNIDIPNSAVYCTLNVKMESFGGTIHLTADSTGFLRFNSGGNSTSAQICTGSTNATFDLGNGSGVVINRNGGGTSFGNYDLGALSGDLNTFLRGCASGSSASTYSIGANNLSTTFAGTIEDGPASGAVVAITKTGTGTLTLLGQNNYSGATTVSNGVLALAYNSTNTANGSIAGSTQINILPGAILDVSGRSDGTLYLASGQQLRGRGTVNGILDTTEGGMVAPGGGPGGNAGTLYVTNNINLGGTTWMKLNRANTPNSDQLASTLSTITYGGTLVATNIGAKLQPGDTFKLFSGGGLSASTFGTVVLPNYYTWNTSQLGVNGSITVTGVLPPPSITNADFSALSGGTLTLNAANGAPNGPVIVLTTTNLAAPISTWTSVATNNFDANGNLSLPITVDPTLPQSFFVLQAF